MYKAYWINVFKKGKGISFLVINRIINCVLFLYLDLMFTFQINASLLIASLVFKAHSILKHLHSLSPQSANPSLLCRTNSHMSEKNSKLKQLKAKTDDLGAKYGAELG